MRINDNLAKPHRVLRLKVYGCFCLLLIAVCFNRSVPAQNEALKVSEPDEDQRISIETDLTSFHVSVTDSSGRALPGLKPSDFSVFDDNKLQVISFFSAEDLSLSVGVVFDTSGSMQGEKIIQARVALNRFLLTSKNEDDFTLIRFNESSDQILCGSRDINEIKTKIEYVEPSGNTALYDAVYAGLKSVGKSLHARKILLVISDGEDNNSRLNYKKIRQYIQESGVVVYAISIGGKLPVGRRSFTGRDVLEELAEISGGRVYFPGSTIEMDEAFEKIALGMRHLYSIGFYPTDSAQKVKHKIKVSVKLPAGSSRALVRNRKLYYSKPSGNNK